MRALDSLKFKLNANLITIADLVKDEGLLRTLLEWINKCSDIYALSGDFTNTERIAFIIDLMQSIADVSVYYNIV